MSRAPPSVAAPPPEVDAKLMAYGINIDQRKRLMIAARLGIGPAGIAPGLPGPRGGQISQPTRARSRSPTELPGPAGSSGYTAAQAAAAEREKRRRELERKKDDDDEMDLQAFMGGCKKAAKRAEAEKERQRIAAIEKAKEEALQAELRERRRREEMAAAAARPTKAARTAAPSQPSEEEVLAMLRGLHADKSSPSVQLSTETCAHCGQPFTTTAKFCSECGAKRASAQDGASSKPARQFREDAPVVASEEQRRETSEEARRNEEKRRLRREEKQRKREEKARQRELANGQIEKDGSDEASSSPETGGDGKSTISAKNMDDSMRRHWGESVKGRVSTDNKGFSDAALERRFQLAAGGPAAAGGEKLMSEEQVLAMLRKPKARN